MPNLFKAETAALLLIDYQVGTLGWCKTTPAELAVRNALELVQAAQILGIPILMTSSEEDNMQGAISPDLQKAAPDAFKNRIKRTGTVDAWQEPAFKAAVEATGRRQLIMGAITTDICLVFPAISAVRDGYEVQAVIDASGSPLQVSEDMARRRMENAGVVLTATDTLLAELAQNWSTPQGIQLIQLIPTGFLPISAPVA